MAESSRPVRIPQQKRSIEKRAALVAAAGRVFVEKGFHAASTNEIVRESGLSTGTLYSYFADKKALFLEAVEAHYARLNQMLEASLAAIQPGDAELVQRVLPATLHANVEAIPFHKEVMAMVFTDADVRALYFAHQESVIDLIQFHAQRWSLEVSREQVFLMITLVENIGREFIYHPTTSLNRDALLRLSECVVQTLIETLG